MSNGSAAGSGRSPAGIDETGVGAWMAAHVRGAVPPFSYRQIAGGHSNLTFAVTDRMGHRYVLRRPPTGLVLPTAHDMGREYRILSAVKPAGVPVPLPLGYCSDPAVTGAAFYVMQFVDGAVLRTREELEATFPLERRRGIAQDVVAVLARLHSLIPDAVGLGDLSRKEGYVARQLKRWYRQYLTVRDTQDGPDVPNVDAAHAMLIEQIPPQGPAAIVHGDYRLDNLIIGPEGDVVGVLDWELCTLGDPLADLGQLIMYWAAPGEAVRPEHSATTAAGFPTRMELAAAYAEQSGRDISVLDFYVAFAYWKLACICAGVYARYAAGAQGDDDTHYEEYPERIRYLSRQAVSIAGRL